MQRAGRRGRSARGRLRRKYELRLELVSINSRMSLLRQFGDELESAQSCDTDGEWIVQV